MEAVTGFDLHAIEEVGAAWLQSGAWRMAMWIPEVERGRNDVRQMFRVLKLSSLINGNDAVRVEDSMICV